MVKNQLFKFEPTEELCLEVVQSFGLQSLDDTTSFSKKDLIAINAVGRLYALKSKLDKCYIPCKARTYLNDITPKNAITILRQFMRCVDKKVISKEKYYRGTKYVIYQIIPTSDTYFQPLQIKYTHSCSSYMINFD
tara:strand:- start:591 stop:998 length:408 start_codon:yes stop_codon:yes gene_type:complete